LDYAEEKFGKVLVMETRVAMKIIFISIPTTIFWALLQQQRSKWTFQAIKMNLDLGFYVIKPDQMIVLNSIVAIIMIPTLDKIIYPGLAKVGIVSSLHRMSFGGFLAAISCVFAIFVELHINKQLIHICWLIPQFITMGVAEVIIHLSHLNFAYQEAPKSLKPIMVSLLFLSMAFGNLFIAFISSLSLFKTQVFEYLFYIALLFTAEIAFLNMIMKYKHLNADLIYSPDVANTQTQIRDNIETVHEE
jgi:dipeptide/tripeptide permease